LAEFVPQVVKPGFAKEQGRCCDTRDAWAGQHRDHHHGQQDPEIFRGAWESVEADDSDDPAPGDGEGKHEICPQTRP
jgi:hypothetical protein